MAIHFTITPGSSSPIYRQIEDCVRRAILTGRVHPGEPLPSVRSLAEELLVNPNTVVRAYAELASRGLVLSQPGRGFFLAEWRQTLSLAERRHRLHEAAANFAQQAGFLDFSTRELLNAVEEALTKTRKDQP